MVVWSQVIHVTSVIGSHVSHLNLRRFYCQCGKGGLAHFRAQMFWTDGLAYHHMLYEEPPGIKITPHLWSAESCLDDMDLLSHTAAETEPPWRPSALVMSWNDAHPISTTWKTWAASECPELSWKVELLPDKNDELMKVDQTRPNHKFEPRPILSRPPWVKVKTSKAGQGLSLAPLMISLPS